MFQRLWQTIRQWRYPPEFRIDAPPALPEVLMALQKLETLMRSEAMSYKKEDETLLGLIAELVTGLWRLRNRLQSILDDREDLRRLKRILQAVWEAMEAMGVRVHDHVGEDYDPGMAVEVLTFQDDKALTKEQIIEAVKPSVFVHGRLVQWGVVIVGRPVQKEVKGDDGAVDH